MANTVNLDAYFKRIGYGGDTRPNLQTLAEILDAHALHVPFENFDVLLGRPVRLDLDGLQRKVVAAHRGGYCFEQATLFAAVLEAIGFQPVRHTSRVILFAPRTASPRTHMFLTVALAEGTFIVDPGFGFLGARVPVPVDGTPAHHRGESHRVVRDGRFSIMRAQVNGKSGDAWVSTMEEENPVDFEMGNHFTATHASSPFMNRIMLSAVTPDGRVTIMNREATVWKEDKPNAVQLADRAHLRKFTVEYLGFDLPEIERLRVPTIPEWA